MSRVWGVVLIAAGVFLSTGCVSDPLDTQRRSVCLRLLALTVLESDSDDQGKVVRAFVQPTDTAPVQWYRFELYERMPYDVNPRGKRLLLWPEIEPGLPRPDNAQWHQRLGAYEIALPVTEPIPKEKRLLLEVTALTADGRRCSDTVEIESNTNLTGP